MRARVWLFLVPASAAFVQNPKILDGGVVDAASFTSEPTLAPGGLGGVFGSDLAGTLPLADSTPLATQLADASVKFGNIPAPLLAAIPSGPSNPGEVNAQLPWNVLPQGLTTDRASVAVSRGRISSPPLQVPIDLFGFGILAYPSGIGRTIAVIQTASPTEPRYGALAAPLWSFAGMTATTQVTIANQ